MNTIGTFWAMIPALVAIVLALCTKEVYSSLFIGIISGAILFVLDAGTIAAGAGGFSGFLNHLFSDGLIGNIADATNIGILIFMVILGTMVALINKTGGSAAFGRWASTHIKTKMGAQITTIILGLLIFVDDYFNCLTVGSVMKPVTDKHGVSKEKLAYLIDSTAAPVCIIAPISSWAAAVAGFVSEGENGIELFCKAIPFNFYAILTILMMFILVFMKFDYGPMAKSQAEEVSKAADSFENANPKGKILDLVLPIVILIILCVVGMIYTGGFFTKGEEGFLNFIIAFSNSDNSVGLVIGSIATVVISVIYYLCRKVLSFKECMECLPEGFKAMVPAILILCLAWTLKGTTDSLQAKQFVSSVVEGSAQGFKIFLPAIIFIIAVILSFATGTSWGTFSILIPICIAAFPEGAIRIVSISACMAGAVCGDHCSPISDTTIMASAGAQCKHIAHVSTQLPYAMTVAVISFVAYAIQGITLGLGLIPSLIITWICAIALLVGTLFVIKKFFVKE